MIEYINHDWYYLNWDDGKYYTKFQSRILTPSSLGLETHQAPTIDTFRLPGNSGQTMVVSESTRDTPADDKEGSALSLRNNTLRGISHGEEALAFGFDDLACLSASMATTTMQKVEATRELAQEGGTGMYRPYMYCMPELEARCAEIEAMALRLEAVAIHQEAWASRIQKETCIVAHQMTCPVEAVC